MTTVHTMNDLKKMKSETDWKRIDAMTNKEITKAALSDPDNPPLTSKELSGIHRRSHQKTPVTDRITIRLNHEIADYFKSYGKDWQTRINEVLQKHIDSHHHKGDQVSI